MNALVEKYLSEAAEMAAPIPGEAPHGADISYDADFEVVRVEIDKLTAMSGELPNWKEIVSASENLLRTRSKDMRLAIWMAGARFKLEGVKGLARGLATVRTVSEAHWEGMYPPLKRAKARANLAGWLGDLALADLGAYEPKASDKEAFEALSEIFNSTDEVLSSKLGDAYAGMGPIRSMLRDKLRMIPAEVAPVAAPPTPTTSAASPTPVTAAPAPTAPLAAPALDFAPPQVPAVT
ncbi:MAG TPA: type VI secretion system ImpA family N-terminal domain-containing protein, partial [Polyangiaceae bacterium]|nr:type VI secretion system ImpA family N-terminal domain-containing protein [Polyangiaceae bacterium]